MSSEMTVWAWEHQATFKKHICFSSPSMTRAPFLTISYCVPIVGREMYDLTELNSNSNK